MLLLIAFVCVEYVSTIFSYVFSLSTEHCFYVLNLVMI